MTEIIVASSKRKRTYVRRFDHDEARRRFEAGEKALSLALEYGVTETAVYHAVLPGEKQRQVEYHKRWRTGTCETCGKPAMRNVGAKRAHNPDGRVLCIRCRADEKRERLLFDDAGALIAVRCTSLDCVNGERWQPPSAFTRGVRHREVRVGGIHSCCRGCQTRAKRRWRERTGSPT